MLTLLIGTDWVANRDEIFSRVAQDVKDQKGNRILLVPELISHDTERRLASAAGDTCSRFAEVLTFSRLVKRVCQWCVCGATDCLDNGGRLIAMASATRQIHSKLKAYASVETRPEFLTGLVDAVDEFKRCCISSEDLLHASRETEGIFAQKLEELSLVLDAYDAVCGQSKIDPRDQMNWLLEELEICDFAGNHTVYIDGFPDFTRQHMAVLEHFIVNCENIVITVNTDCLDTRNPAFEKSSDTMAQLIRIARKHNISYNVKQVTPRNNVLHTICTQIFHGNTTINRTTESVLRVCQAESIQTECTLVAEQILELIHSGVRYRQIAVACGDLAGYSNALQSELTRCGIPVYIAGTEDILDKSVISTVLNALDAALEGFQMQDVVRYIKSVVSPLSLQVGDKIENYAYLWGVRGNGWLKEWTMHPRGLETEWLTSDIEDLKTLNAARELVVNPLHTLRDSFSNARTLSEQVEAILKFLENIDLRGRLDSLAQEMDQMGDNRNAQILSQLWEILLTAMEQLSSVLGNTTWDSDTFTRLLKLLLSQYDVGTIPTVLDTVTVGSVSAMRCQQIDHLIVLGANEGVFPKYAGTSGVLTDQERKSLRQMGVPLTGGAAEGLQIELSEIYSVFCGAEKSIYVSSLTDRASFAWKRLLQMSPGLFVRANVLGAGTANANEAAAFLLRRNAEAEANTLGISTEYALLQNKKDHSLGKITKEGVNSIYGQKLNLSASQVDKQADCRLAYFLKYGLRAEPRKTADVDPAEFGTYVHAVLEQTARDVCDMGGFKKVTQEETMRIALTHSEKYISEHFAQIDSDRLAYLFTRNVQELKMVVEELWNEFQNSAFVPVGFEVAFGEHAELAAIPIPGKTMDAQLRGFVDRIDAWHDGIHNYFRVVDYKTGQKSFDYCDVFNGLGLQMLIYLFALEQEGEQLLGNNSTPAGVQYFPARAPVITSDGELTDDEAVEERKVNWKRKGLLLCDEEVLCAMENCDPPERLPWRRRKDGTISGDVADSQQFRLLRGYIFHILEKMVDDIASGNVEPNPYTRGSNHDACRFCDFSTVCHAATVEGRRNYKTMNSERFWEEVEKEMSKLG